MRKLRTIEMQRLSVEQFHEAEKMPLVVVLDDVRSLYNVGSVFRSCDLPRGGCLPVRHNSHAAPPRDTQDSPRRRRLRELALL